MYFIVVFILNDLDHCQNILDAWENAGIRGITILESSGLGRIRQAALLDDLPLMPSLHDLFVTESNHRTLFTVIKSQEKIDAIVEATQSIVGDLENPNTGLLFVMPVSQVYGKGKLA